ncbi:MAG: GyrI-like domain-containing protein [Ignavibacteria bacterium]|nr:GyrI-like domain-containing protein [Ignavibacteria bacterium]
MQTPTFREMGAKKLIGCSIYTSGTKSDFPEIWDVFIKRMDEIPHALKSETSYAVEFLGQEFHTEGKWFYMPCIEVTEFDEIPILMVAKTIPAARYAVFTHTGDISGVHELYTFVFKEWLPNSEFEMAFDFNLELYDERFLGVDNPESQLEILVPVRSKSV